MDFKRKWSDYKFRVGITNEHPNHTDNRYFKSCKKCVNENLLKESKVMPCPDCGLFTLQQRLYRMRIYYDTEFYCTDCGETWRRVED